MIHSPQTAKKIPKKIKKFSNIPPLSNIPPFKNAQNSGKGGGYVTKNSSDDYNSIEMELQYIQ